MECPVCNRAFPQTEINKHVNVCLNLKEDDQCTSGANGGRIPNRNVPTKRKSSSNWGSLQPMRKSNLTDSVKKPDKTFGDKGSKVVTSRPEGAKTNDMINHEFCSPPKNDLLMQSLAAAELESLQDQPVQPPANRNSEPSKSNSHSKADSFAPLAERVRPKELENYVGQDKVVGKESMLYSLLQSDHIPSIILWGPPGCGKTTLARIIANNCRSRGNAKFVSLSAAACGVNEVKDVIKIARNDQKMFHKKTVMFLDEIHRFNKMQQDVLLPHVEDGTVTLIGATTENPSFQVNSALLSRCRVIVLDKLSGENVLNILQKALPYTGAVLLKPDQHSETDRAETDVYIDSKALEVLANLVDGDARAALNGLQMAVESKGPNSRGIKGSNFARKMKMDSGSCGKHIVTVEDIKEGLQRSHVLYDKAGEEHYNIISALHKSMRGSDASASLYWLARMLEGGENPLYIARRLIRFASEDIGLADPMALTQAVSAYQGCHLIGMPECDVLLAQCVVYLARAPKSVEILQAYGKAKTCIRQHKGPLPSVPLHLRNAPTALMKDLGYGKDYKYNPSYEEPVDQDYFPSELVGTDFFT